MGYVVRSITVRADDPDFDHHGRRGTVARNRFLARGFKVLRVPN